MNTFAHQLGRLTPHQRQLLSERLHLAPSSSETLTAYITGTIDDTQTLRTALLKQLPAHMVPTRFEVLDQMPTLPNGKIDVRALSSSPSQALTTQQGASGARTDFHQPITASPTNTPDSARLGPRLDEVRALWSRLLGGVVVEPDSNFFELGGHSLLVIEMVDALADATGTRLKVADVFRDPTPCGVANRLASASVERLPVNVIHLFPIQPEGDTPPVFVIQPDFFSGILCDAVGTDRPIVGLRAVGHRTDGNVDRWPTLTDLAEEMVQEIGATWPNGPYLIAGYSFGAVIAVEVARLLEARSLPVERLILFDPTPWNVYRNGPICLQLRTCSEPVIGMSFPRAFGKWLLDNNPCSPKPYRRLGRILWNTPKRYVLQQLGKRRRDRGAPFTTRQMEADSDYERFRLFFQHRPLPVAAPVLFFNAREPETDAAALWAPFFKGPLDVHQIPNLHLHLAGSPETRQQIVERLREELAPAPPGTAE